MFAVLLLPAFPLQAVLRLEAEPPRGPAVVTEATGRQSRIVARNVEAEAVLIRAGMTVAQARARYPEVAVFSRRPTAESAAMDLVFGLLYAHTPRIERTAPGLFTTDLRGSRLRDGDSTGFGLLLLDQLNLHGLGGRIGLAPLPELARFAAQATVAGRPILQTGRDPESLGGLRFEATGCSPELTELLGQLGLRHLGEFLRLPRAEVSRRLGAEALTLWEAASGAKERLLQIEPPPRNFKASQELDYRVHTLEPLLFLLRRFLDQLEVQLRAASQYASHLTLTLQLDHADPYERRFKLPEPSQRAELLFRILHLHLEQVHTQEAIVGAGLSVDPVDPPHRQRGLFHTSLKNPWRFADTQAQLLGLLGPGAVGRPRLLDTHEPDRFVLEPVLEEVAPLAPSLEEAATQRTGPALRRFRPPQAAEVQLHRGRPTWVQSSQHGGRILRTHGPFHLSGDWWQRDTAWRRAEWDAELTTGTALRLREERGKWFVEGVYD